MGDITALLMFPALMVLIFAGIPIAFSMILVAAIFGYTQFGDAVAYQLLTKIEDSATNYILAAVPLFVFMGAVLERSGIAERLFNAIHVWTYRLPGGLGVGAIFMGALFAASSGVVGATEAVIGMLAIPIMLKHQYSKSLISGTICASGSLGTAIPPSITIVILGPVAGVSVGALFSGMLIPGLLMASLFLLYIVGIAYFKPHNAPRVSLPEDSMRLSEKIKVLVFALVPTMALIFIVLGTILSGLATPTEAAACGALGAVVLAAIYKNLTMNILWDSAIKTMRITAMILFIVMGGSMFASIFFAAGGMATVQNILMNNALSPFAIIALILLIAFIAGFVLDLISVVLIIIPVAMPIVRMLGFDEVWFCIAFLVVLQTSYLTPPLAPAIFYLRAITPPEIKLKDMYIGVIPFIVVQLLVLLLVILFPSLSLWLPEIMSGPSW